MLAACRLASQDGCRVVLSGLGSEEAFGGYQRHQRALGSDRLLGLAQMWHRDLQRDFAVAQLCGVEIRYPFLDRELLCSALRSDGSEGGKVVLRRLARRMGAPKQIYERRKRAAQYGSRIYNALKILSNVAGKESKERFHQANYVMSVPGAKHAPVALLLTSGYHSVQVYCLLSSWRCQIACVIPPAEDKSFAEAFATDLGLPLAAAAPRSGAAYDVPCLVQVLHSVREAFQVEGVACGHVCDLDLYSSLTVACDRASLRAYAPEWGSCAESQSSMRRIVHDGTVLRVKKFPAKELLGCTVASPEEADLLLQELRRLHPEATDDVDAGHVDCDFVSSPFLPCGVSEQKHQSVALALQKGLRTLELMSLKGY